jgi:hypothetical protein
MQARELVVAALAAALLMWGLSVVRVFETEGGVI